jgi:hypothetical protein
MLVLVALLWAAVEGAAFAEPVGDVVSLRAAARTVLKARCMPCHSESAKGKKPRATAAFDLDTVEWSSTLSDEALPKLMGRLQSSGTPAEQEKVQAFIDAELRARAAARAP